MRENLQQKESEIANMKVDHPRELDKCRYELSQQQRGISHLQQEIERLQQQVAVATQTHGQAAAELERVTDESRQRQNSM